MKQYDITYSAVFMMAHGTPWVVQCEGEKDCWNFKTEQEARDFVTAKGDGKLRSVRRGEQKTYERWAAA